MNTTSSPKDISHDAVEQEITKRIASSDKLIKAAISKTYRKLSPTSSKNTPHDAADNGGNANGNHCPSCKCWPPNSVARRREVIHFPLNSRFEWVATPYAKPNEAGTSCNCGSVGPTPSNASQQCGSADAGCCMPPAEFFPDPVRVHGSTTPFWSDPVELRAMMIAVFGIVLLENAVFAGFLINALVSKGH